MEKQIKVCDNPGCAKSEENANHWFKLLMLLGAITVSRVGVISPPALPHSKEDWKDACGRKCAAEMVANWMGEGDPK